MISLRASMATDAIRLANDISLEMAADYPGVVAVNTSARTGDGRILQGLSMGLTYWHIMNPIYILAVADDRVRFYLREEPLKPLLTPVLPGPGAAYTENRESMQVHPEEPSMSFLTSSGFLRISMDRLEYDRNKERYMRMLRFVLDAEKMRTMELESEGFAGPGQLNTSMM